MKKNNIKYIKLLSLVTILFPKVVNATCSDYCNDLAPAVRFIKHGLVPIFQIVIPIGLIIMGMVDLAKAVMAGKEDEQKKAQSMLVKRFIYAVAVFFVITIVTLAMNLFDDTNTGVKGTQDWYQCWSAVDTCKD